MTFGVILIAVIFFGLVIYNSNRENRIYQQSPKQNLEPRRVTIDSILKAEQQKQEQELFQIKRKMIREFEKVVEAGFRDTLNKATQKFPPNATDAKSQMNFLKQEMFIYAHSVRTDPVFTEVLSGVEIQEIIEKSNKKVIGEILFYLKNK